MCVKFSVWFKDTVTVPYLREAMGPMTHESRSIQGTYIIAHLSLIMI